MAKYGRAGFLPGNHAGDVDGSGSDVSVFYLQRQIGKTLILGEDAAPLEPL